MARDIGGNNLRNFFGGFIVSSGTYFLLCKFFPIPATSDVWMEVGDEITEISVAYGDSNSDFDEERNTEGKGFNEGGVVNIDSKDQKRDLSS